MRNNSGLYGGCVSVCGVNAQRLELASQMLQNRGTAGGGVLALVAGTTAGEVLLGSKGSCTIRENKAGEGGVVYVSESATLASLTVDDACVVSSNVADGSGGFLSVTGNGTIDKAALGGSYNDQSAGLYGGVVNVETSGAAIRELAFQPGSSSRGNKAGSSGGLLYVGSGARLSVFKMLQHTSHTNSAGGEGGVLAVMPGATLGETLMANSSIINSLAAQGSCVYLAATALSTNLTLINSTFSNSSAIAGNGGCLNIAAPLRQLTMQGLTVRGSSARIGKGGFAHVLQGVQVCFVVWAVGVFVGNQDQLFGRVLHCVTFYADSRRAWRSGASSAPIARPPLAAGCPWKATPAWHPSRTSRPRPTEQR